MGAIKRGELMRKLRLERGLSQEAVSFEVDTVQSHIGRLERANVGATIELLKRISDFYGQDWEEFYGKEDLEKLPPLKRERIRKCWNVSTLAEKTGLKKNYIHTTERKQKITDSKKKVFAKALGIDVSALDK